MRLRILDICKKRGVTQKELAEKIGLTPVGLSKAINGNPTKSTLEKIAQALNVQITDLFEENDGIVGFVKFAGQIFEIKSKRDLEELLQKINLIEK